MLVPAVMLLAACGEAGTSSGGAGTPMPRITTTPSTGTTEVYALATVLQAQGGPAALCLAAVAESYPPQCSGPPIPNWDWGKVSGQTKASGVTWGEYVVIGTYDGERFTLTGPASTPEEYDGPLPSRGEDPSLLTPCEEPAGGWAVVDPSLVGQGDLDRTVEAASTLDGYADLWVDQSPGLAQGEEPTNDRTRLVLNVRVTGDVAAAEERLRQTWGGALCVTKAQRTEAELRGIQERLVEVPGILTSSYGRDVVSLDVFYDDGTIQRSMDATYGAGVVVVTSALQPFPG